MRLSNNITIQMMYEALEALQDKKPRSYLGMSSIGYDCTAKLWFSFRLASEPHHDAKTLMRFADGHLSEDITASRLKQIEGVELITHDKTGEQFSCAALGGHFRGHADGIILGFSHSEVEAIWEHKCVAITGATGFNKINKLLETLEENDVLIEWNKAYFAQAQMYMRYMGFDVHFLTVATPGSREYTEVTTTKNKPLGEYYEARASDIIQASEVPEKISENPEFFACVNCEHAGVCHGEKLPIVTCRSCAYSSPIIDDSEDAKWHCRKHDQQLDYISQMAACNDHIYIPTMLNAWAYPVDFDGETVEYEVRKSGRLFFNGRKAGQYSSLELYGLESINDIHDYQARD